MNAARAPTCTYKDTLGTNICMNGHKRDQITNNHGEIYGVDDALAAAARSSSDATQYVT